MTKPDDDFEVVHGSGNVFRDFGYPVADVQQTKALLATQIVGILDDEGLSKTPRRKPRPGSPMPTSHGSAMRNLTASPLTG